MGARDLLRHDQPWKRFVGSVLLLAMVFPAGRAGAEYFGDMSLDELGEVDVFTASIFKSEMKLTEFPGAVSVLTGEEIRRSGVTTIADALRMVPGLHVARIDSNTWNVSSRGHNFFFARGMLVMVDGRSVYSPQDGDVNWAQVDTFLPDIERIDVVRGPGGAVWGANSFNGVINIVTKRAEATQGGKLELGVGTHERAFAGGRFGGAIGKEGDAHYRLYAKGFSRDEAGSWGGVGPFGGSRIEGEGGDDWKMGQVGGRLDWSIDARNELSLQGDYYQGKANTTRQDYFLTEPLLGVEQHEMDLEGGNLMLSWRHEFSETWSLDAKTFYDRSSRTYGYTGGAVWDTFDFDIQSNNAFGRWGYLVWGGGYRFLGDRQFSGENRMTATREDNQDLYRMFGQYEVDILSEQLALILGSKFENNHYTGWEVQPSARLAWTPSEEHTLWGSLSRSVRTPTRIEDDADALLFTDCFIDGADPCPAGAVVGYHAHGNKALAVEDQVSLELGYRYQPELPISLDVALFYNEFEDIVEISDEPLGFVPVVDPPPPHFRVDVEIDNGVVSSVYGGEVELKWDVSSWWDLVGSYSVSKTQIEDSSLGGDGGEDAEGYYPRHQLKLISFMDLPWNLELDSTLFAISELYGMEDVDDRLDLTLRLAWHPIDDLELALVGQNLLYDEAQEILPPDQVIRVGTATQRGAYFKLTWDFK